jgi:ParB family chromosome partitioning protein
MGEAQGETGTSVDYMELPINSIAANPDQPRIEFSEERIEELAASIKKDGLLQPILVRPLGSGYQIIAGERRWQACKRLGKESMPAKILFLNDAESQQVALVENLQRDNLNPIEEARGYKRLIDLSGCLQKDLADAVSKKPATISNALRLLDLSEDIQEMMLEGLITSGHGRAVLALEDDEARLRLAKKIAEEHLSVREAESLARLFSTQGLEKIKRPPSPRSFKLVARKLRQRLGTNVRVKSVRGKNKIEIEFVDEDDLQRIFQLIEDRKSRTTDVATDEADTEETALHEAETSMPAQARASQMASVGSEEYSSTRYMLTDSVPMTANQRSLVGHNGSSTGVKKTGLTTNWS